MNDRLNDSTIEGELEKLPGWRRDGDALVRVVEEKDFAEAMIVVNAIAHIATAVNHHPEITVDRTKVTIRTTSHNAGAITARDVDLATRIQAILTPR
ncbi:MAG: 4a-hydroxytetrahydrobiopterin dehydratase [Candidatus Eremiobacteraeota bacterium]|nr:4a-hydroxytetrahydrobiopterin dehydratase [Candidatus Eremiobacteraeota bacterium]